jgi:hypothetical protein
MGKVTGIVPRAAIIVSVRRREKQVGLFSDNVAERRGYPELRKNRL